MIKFLVVLTVVAACAAVPEYSIREKRGLLAAPIPISYSSHVVHHAPSVAVAYHAPLPAVKIVQPLPVAKYVAPAAVTYTKIAYPSVLPYYGYAHGYTHGFGHFH